MQTIKPLLILLLMLGCVSLLLAQDTPATTQQVKDAFDWSKTPLLDGASKKQTLFNHISYQAPGTFSQAADFYKEKLPALGWTHSTALSSGDQKEYLSLTFEKNGMMLSVSGYRSQPNDPMTITLMNFGNVDVSRFPKPGDAVVKTNNKNAVYYFTKESPEALTVFIRKFMKERGWKEKEEDGAKMWEKEGRYVLSFQQNAMECTMVAAKKDGQLEVTYTAQVQHDLSAEDISIAAGDKAQEKPATLKQAEAVLNIMKLPRMPKAEKAKHQKELVAIVIGTNYQVPDSLEDAVKFYRQLLKENGCTELSPMIETDSLAMLYFEKSGFLFGLSASRDKKENTTRVALMNYGNVDLRKLPAPEGAKIETLRTEHMNLQTKLSIDDAHEFYRRELARLGWKDSNPKSKVTMKFTQNGVSLSIEIQKNSYGKTSVGLHTGMR